MERNNKPVKRRPSGLARIARPLTRAATGGVSLAVRLSDLYRSSAYVWLEASLKNQERLSRSLVATQVMARTSLLTAVAADLIGGYTNLDRRAKRWPDLVTQTDWEWQHRHGATRLFDTASSLGGALIKACQFASTRPDLFPPAYTRTLAPLQDRLVPHPWPVMEADLVRELGRPLHEVFREIEQTPVAAASIAQVHRAWLHDGRKVAVKIQYPEVADLIHADLEALQMINNSLGGLFPDVHLQPVLDYLKETLPMELDLAREAQYLTELREALAFRTDDVLVPEALREFSTSRLLVMDFVEGIKITDKDGLEKAGIDPKAVARLLNDVYAEQIMRLGILHGDPHPGNILVQPGPRLVLVDHGLTVRLKPELTKALADMVRSLLSFDMDGLTAALEAAGVKLDGKPDLPSMLQIMGVLFNNNNTAAGGQATANLKDIAPDIGHNIGRVPVDLLLVGRALGSLDGITRQLDPRLNVLEIVLGYVAQKEPVH